MSWEHTNSWYAATLNDDTRYPSLQGDHVADVCVIGAGFTGISAALHLAERGYNVHVVEANRVAWGASGRNGGQMIGGISGEQHIAKHYGAGIEDLLWDLRWAGHRIIRERVDTYEIDCDLKYGYLDVAIKERHLRAFAAEYERLEKKRFPHDYRLLSGAETRDATGTDAYIGGLLNMGNGHLHPLNLCMGEARAAASQGAHIWEQSRVTRIEKGSKARVVTDEGSVTADAVVIAGNAYHLLEPALRGVMFPVNSFIVATEPLPAETVAEINPLDVAICDPNFVLEYYRLSPDKRLLFGGRLNYFGDDPAVIARRHRGKIRRLYPQLADVRIDYAWGGRIGVPVYRAPIMGRVEPNIFYSQGYAGHGVNVTHLAGELLADAIAGTFERFDVFANIRPLKVPGAHVLATPMVALGVLYYQVRDRLA
ncbi:MAG TPA: FAD-binding oxidoreductase [Woeseiaceae bacterium]|nr:FAD-binding oxidoreductase [Woeseiaceae bacterium]